MFVKRHAIRKKEAKKLLNEINSYLGCSVEGNLEMAEYVGRKIFLVDGKLEGIFIEGKPFLTVNGIKRWRATKKWVMVDDGAIKFILNGADVMAPGIIKADESIAEGDIVWVCDERKLPLAVGIAIMNGGEMITSKKGKAVENLHHMGDDLWKAGEW